MKNNKYSLLLKLIVLVLLSSTVAMAAMATHILYQSSGISTFKLLQDSEGMKSVVKTSQNYDLYRKFSEVGGDELILVSSARTVQENLDMEGATGSVSWSVRTGMRLERVLWVRSESATELNVHGMQPVVVSGLTGCCGAVTGYRLFNLETGRLLMSFNDFSWREKVVQPFSIEVPNSNLSTRYIGGLTQDSTRDRDFIDPAAGKQAALMIKYANEMLQQKIQVDMEIANGYAPSVLEFQMEVDSSVPGSDIVEIRDDQVQLWNIDGTQDPLHIRGVLLKVVLEGGLGLKTLKIPVKNDRLDLASTIVPTGVSLRSVAP